MNWDQIEGKWKQFVGSARDRWGKLTDNDWEMIAGKKEHLIGSIQERYGVTTVQDSVHKAVLDNISPSF
jgi:uncharacterized protein YjbJ (UPF0337 family)